jgi:hypothetical protein
MWRSPLNRKQVGYQIHRTSLSSILYIESMVATTTNWLLVLAPLDAVESNTLLDKLPQRAELSQESDSFLHRFQNIVNLTRGRKSSNAKSDTAVCTLIAVAEGAEHVAGLQ